MIKVELEFDENEGKELQEAYEGLGVNLNNYCKVAVIMRVYKDKLDKLVKENSK